MAILGFDEDLNFWRILDFKNFWVNEKKILNFTFSVKKTGTTICGLVYGDGIILASDTRSTNGEIICDSNCEKIHYIAPNIACCGAGTSGDIENLTKLASHQLELKRISTGREIYVVSSVTLLQKILFQHQGFLSAALIIGGFDFKGFHLFAVHPHGSSEKLPFIAMGSGSLASIALLENLYHNDLKIDQAMLIAQQAIMAGIYNDIGSGSSIYFCIINFGSMKILRNKIFNDLKDFKSSFFLTINVSKSF
jgi:20S proteasome subunit beta 2